MAIRPNFQEPLVIKGADLIVAGESNGTPLPHTIQVFVEQDDRVEGQMAAGAFVDRAGSAWQATLPSEGFRAGPALAFGVEVRTQPFLVTTWSQMVEVEVG
jgi:hypothetical protein